MEPKIPSPTNITMHYRSESPMSLSMFMGYKSSLVKSMDNLTIHDEKRDKEALTKAKSIRMRRSVTLKDVSDFKFSRRSKTNISFARIKQAKEKVDEAIKKGKVFSILGPYYRVRQILRNRGWVEKFYLNADSTPTNPTSLLALSTGSKRQRSLSKSNGSGHLDKGCNTGVTNNDGDEPDDFADDDDDCDVDDLDGDGPGPGLPPWEEDDGIYGIMSRMLRNNQPNLFWTLRKNQVDYKSLRKDQIINHHGKSGYFTTKTGLAKSLNQLRWFDDKEPDHFFPRCFIISSLEEKNAFIENYRFTACVSLIKTVIEMNNQANQDVTSNSDVDQKEKDDPKQQTDEPTTSKSHRKIMPKIRYGERKDVVDSYVEFKYLEMAMAFCEFQLKIINHEDIDKREFLFCWSCNWDDFLANYYNVVHDGYKMSQAGEASVVQRCEGLCAQLRPLFPQLDMDGIRNVWILKPGAKSRGRGIMCYNRLTDMLKLVSNSLIIHETRFIVQKYIERPLLVYNTKFDIRQWFLVTDWNPLTIWWYNDAYLRFCSQQFTLEDFNEAVHLSNNSIQNKYKNGPRSTLLPEENMWSWNQFDSWLKQKGFKNAWADSIVPAMKEAVIDALLCVQESMEWRKNTFEMYGADFMISEGDMKPWLIEINSSPCMSPSTSVTAKLTSSVLEDTFKVILDRRENRLADTGRFEMIYRQLAISVPPYIGIDLRVSGVAIRNPGLNSTGRDLTSLVISSSDRRSIVAGSGISSVRPVTDSLLLRRLREGNGNMKKTQPRSPSNRKSSSPRENAMLKISEDAKRINGHKRSSTTITMNSRSVLRNQQLPGSGSRRLADPGRSGDKKAQQFSSPTLPTTTQPEKLDGDVDDDESNSCQIRDLPTTVNGPTRETELDPISIHLSSNSVLLPISSLSSSHHSLTSVPLEQLPPVQHPPSPTTNAPDANSNNQRSSSHDAAIQNGSNPRIIVPQRQYKLPTKVEIVNFSMAKKMIHATNNGNSSVGHKPNTHLQRKITKNTLFRRSSNSQMLIQKCDVPNSIANKHHRRNYQHYSKHNTSSSPSAVFLLNSLNRARTTISSLFHKPTMESPCPRYPNNYVAKKPITGSAKDHNLFPSNYNNNSINNRSNNSSTNVCVSQNKIMINFVPPVL